MAHENVKRWQDGGSVGPRPCDWCGCVLLGMGDYNFIHAHCVTCGRNCYEEESIFYTRLGYDGDPGDIKLPPGYEIVIPG